MSMLPELRKRESILNELDPRAGKLKMLQNNIFAAKDDNNLWKIEVDLELEPCDNQAISNTLEY